MYNVSAPRLSSVTLSGTSFSASGTSVIRLPAGDDESELRVDGTDFGTTGAVPTVLWGGVALLSSSV